jgi:hypothetical protein
MQAILYPSLYDGRVGIIPLPMDSTLIRKARRIRCNYRKPRETRNPEPWPPEIAAMIESNRLALVARHRAILRQRADSGKPATTREPSVRCHEARLTRETRELVRILRDYNARRATEGRAPRECGYGNGAVSASASRREGQWLVQEREARYAERGRKDAAKVSIRDNYRPPETLAMLATVGVSTHPFLTPEQASAMIAHVRAHPRDCSYTRYMPGPHGLIATRGIPVPTYLPASQSRRGEPGTPVVPDVLRYADTLGVTDYGGA